MHALTPRRPVKPTFSSCDGLMALFALNAAISATGKAAEGFISAIAVNISIRSPLVQSWQALASRWSPGLKPCGGLPLENRESMPSICRTYWVWAVTTRPGVGCKNYGAVRSDKAERNFRGNYSASLARFPVFACGKSGDWPLNRLSRA